MAITVKTSKNVSHPSTRGWTLAFDETFSAALSSTNWGSDPGNALPWGDRNNAGATNTLQLYSSDNVAIADGLCTITIQDESPALVWDSQNWDYSSAMMHTHQSGASGKSWRYGWFEIRCKLPSKVGCWPAFWLLQDDDAFPYNWELDVFEQFGSETSASSGVHNGDRVLMTTHYSTGGVLSDSTAFEPGSSGSAPENRVAQNYFTGGFHTFALNWQSDRLEWFIDGVSRKIETDSAKIPNVDMYLLLNCDVDGDAAGDITVSDASLPVEFVIDYVKVWQDS
ncbi:MAG: glycoside hydrolase family 16 protein [Aggregatilineales bacterium]